MKLTDLEITRLCSEAMFDALEWEQRLFYYDPLHDDAQAMALVKRFSLKITKRPRYETWRVVAYGPTFSCDAIADHDTDLNRAICECVAKMMEGKS